MTTPIVLHNHRLAREAAAAHAAARLAAQLNLPAAIAAQLAADARALVRCGCSAAWAIHIARRTARRATRNPEPAA